MDNSSNIITFKSPSSSLLSRIILLIFMTISFLIPILATLFAILFMEFKPAILITYLLFGASGYFFLKLYLWNKFGKENLILLADKIVYTADYKLFKGNRKEINSAQIKIEIIQSIEDEKLGTLKFTNDEAYIESVVRVPVYELIEIKTNLEKLYS